jgi:clathrin heavy chain
MVSYFYRQRQFKSIELFLLHVNSKRLPAVVAVLLDINCSDDQVRQLVMLFRLSPTVDAPFNIDDLINEIEKRNKMKLLLPWLEQSAREGATTSSIHNALAKVHIDLNAHNNNAEQFLKENKFYDAAIVGKYCEKRDPHLAFLCYEKANGQCDKDLIKLCNENGLYKYTARYMVRRRDADLWQLGLSSEAKSSDRRALIDQVVYTVLHEGHDADDVCFTVKSFIAADLPNELIELLEKLLLVDDGSTSLFAQNTNLQNLLILTSIKVNKSKVMTYVNKLANYDVDEIAKLCIKHDLREEAFEVYRKFNMNPKAMEVLVSKVDLKTTQIKILLFFN